MCFSFLCLIFSHDNLRSVPDSDAIKNTECMQLSDSPVTCLLTSFLLSSNQIQDSFGLICPFALAPVGRMDVMNSLSFFLDTFVPFFESFVSFSSFLCFMFTEGGTTSGWVLSCLLGSWENFLFICSPTFPSPPPSFSFFPGRAVWADSFLMLPRENLFSDIGSFLSVGSENLFWECFSFLRLSRFSLSSDRILFLLRFLLGSAPCSWLQALFRGDFFFFCQKKVLLEEEPPIASWTAEETKMWSTWIRRLFWKSVWFFTAQL